MFYCILFHNLMTSASFYIHSIFSNLFYLIPYSMNFNPNYIIFIHVISMKWTLAIAQAAKQEKEYKFPEIFSKDLDFKSDQISLNTFLTLWNCSYDLALDHERYLLVTHFENKTEQNYLIFLHWTETISKFIPSANDENTFEMD